jgi:uncharacterized cupin superfamily protein
MIESYDALATDVPLEVTPDDATATGLTSLVEFGGLEAGIWVHAAGRSTGDFGDEVFVVLSGRGHVTDQHGGRIDLAPGVVGVLRAGDITEWTVTEPIRKVWIASS